MAIVLWSSDSVESNALGLCRELYISGSAIVYKLIEGHRTHLGPGSNMEESPISSNKVVSLSSGLILHGISIIRNTDFEMDWNLTVMSI